MKLAFFFPIFLILLFLSGCVSDGLTPGNTILSTDTLVTSNETNMPSVTQLIIKTKTPTHTASATFTPTLTFTSTHTATSTQTSTMTPPPTLEPKKAKETLAKLLAEPVDCEAPCFWGIVPGQTTFGEAKNIFTRLGLQINDPTSRYYNTFYGIIYEFDNGSSISVIVTVNENIVKNMRIYISPEKYQAGAPRAWLAYSPETLVQRYGTPSLVDVSVSTGPSEAPRQLAIDMHFKMVDMIIQYYGFAPPYNDGLFRVCPLIDNFEMVSIWLGKNPDHPPIRLVPLEDVTSMTLDEFAELMTGDPASACIDLKYEAFLQ